MSSFRERITYSRKPDFSWIISFQSTQKVMQVKSDELCKECDSIKDKEIEELRTENKKLKRLVKFLQNEIKTLELKAALDGEAIPLKEIVEEFTSTAEGRRDWVPHLNNSIINSPVRSLLFIDPVLFSI